MRARSWRPDPEALRGRGAVVAGATRGAGRGIAAALGEAAASVVCTGRSSRSRALRSDCGDRPETIEETAERVTSRGGQGIPAVVDHLDPAQVKDLADRIRETHGHIGYHDPAKAAVNRLAFSQGHELAPHGGTAVAITPGWLRSEMMLEAYRVIEATWRSAASPPGFAVSESPRYVGRAVAALAADPGRARWNQRSVTSAELAAESGFTDLDGSRPDGWAYSRAAEGSGDVDPARYR